MKRIHKKKIQNSIIIFILITIVLFFLTGPLEDKTNESFAMQVQMLLDEYSTGTYTVQEPFTLEHAGSTLGINFNVVTSQNTTMQANITRIMGISGPVSAVFLHDNGSTTFIGLAGLKDIVSETRHGITDSQVSYWESTINSTFSEYVLQGEIVE